ncbi:MAG: hypothetical protein HN513_00440 [Candidatus Pelagibacter sp.]|jgi:hypothetical protein|nr:hypothetical protein [Candidatus Pelagibacter sp.]MBT3693911.1 hypothetical protein [Candidatus Pelagibacter sp.]MDB2527383.1 hypothetical protein [Candidatus Pelagibacter bacterium]|tara:strand:+ start:3948 stop:4631 length:684 start_codon:yes stop_codon:yes gene_type:complete
MKKIFINIILFLLLSSNLNAHVSHYKDFKKIEMEIFRNNELIGYNYYFFTKKNNEIQVTNQIKITVKLLGTIIFDVEGYGEEKYIDDKLISFNSKTKQNKKQKFVNLSLNEEKNRFIIKGSSFSGEANIKNVVGNWWNHKILQAESQISPVSGSIKKQVVTFVTKEKIELYGKSYEAERFTLKSKNLDLPDDKKLNFDIWLEKNTGLILKVKYSRMGDWEYRLKSFE